MKKIFLASLLILLLLTGCGTKSEKQIVKDLAQKVENTKAYQLKGTLEIVNNDDVYNYIVNVSYQKSDKYKVSLKNISNNHEQIILKNSDGVYVLTPSLNKSFKFQSDWPYSNSQIYLLKSIINDIKNDSNRKFAKTKNGYEIITTLNYPNNRKLVKQTIYIDKKLNIKKIEVMNEENVPQITMKFKKIDYKPIFKKNHFSLNNVMKTAKLDDEVVTTSKIEETIYPLLLPTGTKLASEEKVNKDKGNRIIMNFTGEKPFLLVEETASKEDDFTVIPTFGEPYRLMGSIGVMADKSLTWNSNGIEYYMVSEVMSQDELVEVAQSINALPTMK